ncbi:transcriptional regulator, TraR/DksA family [Ekhidna lutea]|uniref:Transcriptional regulator, TraR/DksA family n=1 Tax=Ekhidna lutea TaxID=447679 RepID=A0A239HPE7_EKHLU|nr:TraR/DksA C4-type zinc finger protein [Ekhidna lutea]SNS83045.1 transcriptional regulator, TraR/DksA family [Ekhidna lutea]
MEVDEIRKKIEEEISKTTQLITDYKDQSKPITLDNSIGRISRMDAINNKSITESALRQAESKLSKLHQAMDNIGKPDFGLCIKCKQQIPIGRILLMPESNKCVNCAR